MSDLSELEQISEADIIQALGNEPEITESPASDEVTETVTEETDEDHIEELTNIPEDLLDPVVEELEVNEISEDEIESLRTLAQTAAEEEHPELVEAAEEKNLEISAGSLDDLSNILSKLLNNKTIEITIKVKD